MNIAVIGNPIAGSGKTKRQIERLVEILEHGGHRVDIFVTRVAGDARRRASRVEPDTETIVVAGGDGTMNEVLNGISDPARAPIALLPTGTANILARELGLPYKAEAVAGMIERGIVRKLDMGLVGDRRFLLLASAGFDAMVTEDVQRNRKGPIGYCGYLLSVLKLSARYRAPELQVTVDGQRPLKGALVVVSNVRNYGGIFTVADRACCDSGYLDVCIFPRGTLAALLRYAFPALRGKVSSLPEVAYVTGSSIRIESEAPVAVEVDGDYFGTTPVVIKLKPSCVPILLPHNQSAEPSK